MELRDFRAFTIQKNSAQQFWRELRVPLSIQRDFVFLVDRMGRVGQPLREFAIVCQNEQALALRIEPANVEQPWKLWWKQVENRVARTRIARCRHKTCWLVQTNCQLKIDMYELAVDFHVIARGRLRAKIRADVAVDSDTPGGDELVTFSTRTEASCSEVTIETHRTR